MAKRPNQTRVLKKTARSKLMRNLQIARVRALASGYKKQQKTGKNEALAVQNETQNFSQPFQQLQEYECRENSLELEIGVDKTDESIKDLLNCRRIVNLGHVLHNEYDKISRHGEICKMGKMGFVRETKFESNSLIHFYCDNCEKASVINTDPNNQQDPRIENMKEEDIELQESHTEFVQASSLSSIPRDEVDTSNFLQNDDLNDCDLFGKYIAEKLRALPYYERKNLQRQIMNCFEKVI
ncbi:uncharacterized protein LOC123677198 [Harmonia axyridis]|uniref:uncharacterized protein LOC123677198 n=1 Tax=Harmonia axyridis TaxID=115357 RepID=UPI001E279734|nr:uncharacterized protein LOC123677198 [Harmonia axyridis]